MLHRTILSAGLAMSCLMLPVVSVAQDTDTAEGSSLELSEMLAMCSNLAEWARSYAWNLDNSLEADLDALNTRLDKKLLFEVAGDADRFLVEMHRGNLLSMQVDPEDFIDTLERCKVLGR